MALANIERGRFLGRVSGALGFENMWLKHEDQKDFSKQCGPRQLRMYRRGLNL